MNNQIINQPYNYSNTPAAPTNRINLNIRKVTPTGVKTHQLSVDLNSVSVYDYGCLSVIRCYIINVRVESDLIKDDSRLYLSYQQVFGNYNLQDIFIWQVKNILYEIEPVEIMISQSHQQPSLSVVQIIQQFIISFQTIPNRIFPGFSLWFGVSQKYEYHVPMNSMMRYLVNSNYSDTLTMMSPPLHQSIVDSFFPQKDKQENVLVSKVIQWVSYVKNPGKRRFVFLYYHLCYMASLLFGSINDLAVVIDTSREIEVYLREYLFGDSGGLECEYIDMKNTEKNIVSIYRETKDMPLILSAEDATSAHKCGSVITELLKLFSKNNIGGSVFLAIPVIFSSYPECCDKLLHLEIDKEDMVIPFCFNNAKFNFCSYFSNIAAYLSGRSTQTNEAAIEAYEPFSNMYFCEKQKSDINNEPSIYAAFRTLNWFLKKYYEEIGAKTHHNEEFDVLFKEDIDSFLARFMPTLKLSHSIRKDQFYGTVRNLISEQRVSVFSREKYDLSECASREEFENMPCLLYSKESWAFNDHAVSLIAGAMPEPCSKQRLVNMLDEKGILTNRRINRDSYQNRLRVYFRNGDRDDLELYETRSEDGIIHNDENNYSFESVNDGLYFHLGKKADSDKEMYWDFDNGKNINQHILITGQSGSGKSCFLQNLISQSANQRITTVVFHQQGIIPYCDNAEVVDIYKLKAGLKCFEDDNLDSTKIADRITSALRLTRNQRDIIDENYEIYLDERTKRTNNALCSVGDFIELVLSDKNAFPGITSSILRKLKTLKDLSSSPDDFIDWSEYEGKTVILDFSGNNSDSVWYECFTELYMQDLFLYCQKRFAEAVGVSPMIIVCDEFQNMNMNPNAAMDRILREGRKYGIALWMASQLVQSSQVSRIKQITDQSAMKIYFQTGTERGRKIANILGRTAAERSELQNTLRSLEQREFVFQLNGKTPYKCVADEIKTSKK